MRRRDLFTLGAAGVAAALAPTLGCGPIERVEPAGGANWTENERMAINLVLASRRAAVVRHHLGPAMRPWASNGVLVLGRSAEPDSFDLALPYDTLLDTWIQQLYGPSPMGVAMLINDVAVTALGSEAKVRTTLQMVSPRQRWLQREVYQLWLSDGGWVISSARWTRLEDGRDGENYQLGPYEWRRRDARVKDAREGGDTRILVEALRDAHRWPEAHDELERWTRRIAQEPASERNAAIWALRGTVAVEAGRPRDALPCFRTALRLHPNVKLPGYKAAADARATSGG